MGPMCCGDNFCCSLTVTGSIVCWGGHSFTTPNGNYKAISCAGKAGTAISDDNTIAVCFGESGYGSEGCVTGHAILDTASSFWGGCAIKSSDKGIFCWGTLTVYGVNSRPTLSECTEQYGSASCSAVQIALTPPAGEYTTIACGGKRAGHFCCAVNTSGSTICFGAGSSDYTPTDYPTTTF